GVEYRQKAVFEQLLYVARKAQRVCLEGRPQRSLNQQRALEPLLLEELRIETRLDAPQALEIQFRRGQQIRRVQWLDQFAEPVEDRRGVSLAQTSFNPGPRHGNFAWETTRASRTTILRIQHQSNRYGRIGAAT